MFGILPKEKGDQRSRCTRLAAHRPCSASPPSTHGLATPLLASAPASPWLAGSVGLPEEPVTPATRQPGAWHPRGARALHTMSLCYTSPFFFLMPKPSKDDVDCTCIPSSLPTGRVDRREPRVSPCPVTLTVTRLLIFNLDLTCVQK